MVAPDIRIIGTSDTEQVGHGIGLLVHGLAFDSFSADL